MTAPGERSQTGAGGLLHRVTGPAALAAALGVCIATGIVLAGFEADLAADVVWAASVAVVLFPLTLSIARSLLRRNVGVDAIALFAMAGALALGEYLAGAVVALMLSGGNALEEAATRRARRELTRLVGRAPRTARRVRDGRLEDVAVDLVVPGDDLVVRTGEVVPTDGTVIDAFAVVDESALTGEPLPVERLRGEPVRSGTANAGSPFHLRATRPAAESAYAGIVRLVREAEAARAPFLRMADRYAAILLPVTLATAAGAWIASGDPVRALAVMVIATPCPLILAAPVAFVCGMSRAARSGVILKGSVVVERLGRTRTILLDKTGTITVGTPEVQRIAPRPPFDEGDLLGRAASLEQLSPHVVAGALVRAAADRGIPLAVPSSGREEPGQGIAGVVEGHDVAAGSPSWLTAQGVADVAELPAGADGEAIVAVAIDGSLAGSIVIGDRLRPDAPELVRRLRADGVTSIALVTGDRRSVAERIGTRLGVDRVYPEQTPEGKVSVVRSIRARPEARNVVMIGDGINDAPALAAADVGIAMGAAGATISSEVADAVVLVDRVDRVGDAIAASRRARAIAQQSIVAGIGLSVVGMAFAAAGLLPPIAGAIAQEGIDVAVILNALRALR